MKDKRYEMILENSRDALLDASRALKKEAEKLKSAKVPDLTASMKLCEALHSASFALLRMEGVNEPLSPIGEYISNNGLNYKFI